MPPVSISSKKRPPDSTTVATRSRVTPAVGSTMAMRLPASQLNSDDLPTFGRPTIATTGTATGPLRHACFERSLIVAGRTGAAYGLGAVFAVGNLLGRESPATCGRWWR